MLIHLIILYRLITSFFFKRNEINEQYRACHEPMSKGCRPITRALKKWSHLKEHGPLYCSQKRAARAIASIFPPSASPPPNQTLGRESGKREREREIGRRRQQSKRGCGAGLCRSTGTTCSRCSASTSTPPQAASPPPAPTTTSRSLLSPLSAPSSGSLLPMSSPSPSCRSGR
jgi:hypothetical protein